MLLDLSDTELQGWGGMGGWAGVGAASPLWIPLKRCDNKDEDRLCLMHPYDVESS